MTVTTMSSRLAQPLLDQVGQAAGGGDDDVHALGQGGDLRVLADAAEDRAGLQAHRLGQRCDRVVDLHGQLTGRDEDEPAGAARRGAAAGQRGDQRQRERHRLAAAGAAAAEHVAPGQGVGQGRGLDRERGVDATGGQRRDERRGDAEAGEGRRSRLRGRGGPGPRGGPRRAGVAEGRVGLEVRAADAARAGEVTGVLIVERDGRGCWPISRRGRRSRRQSRRPRQRRMPRTTCTVQTVHAQSTPIRDRANTIRHGVAHSGRAAGLPTDPLDRPAVAPRLAADAIGVPHPGHGLPDGGAADPDGPGRVRGDPVPGLRPRGARARGRPRGSARPAPRCAGALGDGRPADGDRPRWTPPRPALTRRHVGVARGSQRRALWWVLGINAAMFVVELVAGIRGAVHRPGRRLRGHAGRREHLRDRPDGRRRRGQPATIRPRSAAGCS